VSDQSDPREIRAPVGGPEAFTLSRWFVPDGGRVAAEMPLYELEAEKATLEVPAPCDGTLVQLVPEGTPLVWGQLIGWLVPVER
jgi:pyruvate/2-oxoglutarate dehydrogenase complex dihydrolipoamide acyltransferase (E2) component